MKRTTLGAVILSFFPLFISVAALVKPGNGIRGPAFFETAAAVNISNSATDSWYPHVGVDGNGVAYAAWMETLGKRTFYFSTNKGGSWPNPENVTQINSDSDVAGFPAFAVSFSGVCHLIFQDGPDASSDIYHKAYDKAWGALTNVSRNNGRSGDSSCAINPVDLSLYAVWMDDTIRAGDIYLKYRNTLGVWSGTQTLPIVGGYTPRLAFDATGRAHLTWITREGGLSSVWYSRNDTPKNFGAWSTAVLIKDDTWDDDSYPKIDCDNQGNAYIIWRDRTQGNKEIFLRKIGSDGTLGEEANVSQTPGASQEAVLAVNRQNGDLFVAWTENEDIYLNIYAIDSGLWIGAANVTNGVAPSRTPSIAVDSGGVLHIVCAQVSGGNWEIMHLMIRTPPNTSTTTTTTSIPLQVWPPLDLALDTQLRNDQAAKINALTWHRNLGNRTLTLDGYRIFRKPAGTPDGAFTFILWVPPDTFRFVDGELPLSQKNTYRMTTVVQSGEESEASEPVTEASVFPPLNAACRAIVNNSMFRREKINLISWQENPLNDAGLVAQVHIYRKRSDQEDSAYQRIGVLAGDVYEYQDRKVPLGEKYHYLIKTVDTAGNVSGPSNTAKEGP